MKLTKETLAHLKSVAEAATPGPWSHHDNYVDVGPEREPIFLGQTYGFTGREFFANSEHIAAFNPTVALALLSRIESLEGALKWIEENSLYRLIEIAAKKALEGDI